MRGHSKTPSARPVSTLTCLLSSAVRSALKQHTGTAVDLSMSQQLPDKALPAILVEHCCPFRPSCRCPALWRRMTENRFIRRVIQENGIPPFGLG